MPSKPTEASSGCKIDALLFRICEDLTTNGLLDGPKVTCTHHFEISLELPTITKSINVQGQRTTAYSLVSKITGLAI